MSLSAHRIIADVSDPQKATLLRSFYSQAPADQAFYFRGDINRVEFYPVKKADGSSTLYWLPETEATAADLLLGVGDTDSASESGTAALNYDGDGTGLATVSATVSAATLQAALNANPAVVLTGQTVTVTELSDGQYKLAWSGVGGKELVEGDGALLEPQSVVVADWITEGDGSTKAVQLLRFLQRPYVYVDSWTPTGGAAVTFTTLRAGSVSAKAMYAISISPLPYAGSFTVDDAVLAYDGTQADWQTAFGNGWTVLKTGDCALTIEKTTVGTDSLASGDVDVSGLSVYEGFVGTLSFNAASIFSRFAAETGQTFSTSLHLRNDDGTNIDTLHFSDVLLHRDLLTSGSLSPSNWDNGFYRKTEVDAFFALLSNYTADSTSGAETIELSKTGAKTIRETFALSVGAGGGAYTTALELDPAGCAAGDIWRIRVAMPASANPTVTVYSGLTAGTLLYTISGTGSAFTQLLQFTFNGTAWESDQ